MLPRPTDLTSSTTTLLARIALVAFAYYASGRLGLAIPYVGSFITLVWMPTGIALAAMLRWGPPMAVGVWFGAAAVNLSVGGSLGLAAALGTGNTLGPGLAAYFLQRADFRLSFARRADVLRFLLIGAIGGMLITATNGATMLVLFGLAPAERFASVWLVWWIGDAVGVLLAGVPLLASSWVVLRRALAGWRGVETLLVSAVAVGCGAALFVAGPATSSSGLLAAPLLFVPFALVVWLAMRSGVLAGAVTVLAIGILAAAGTAGGRGPFVSDSVHFGLIQLWGYIATLALINLIICALVSESAESRQRLNELFSHSRDAIFLTRPDGTILAANSAACALFGMSESELRERGRSGIVDPSDARRSALLAQRDAVGSATGVVTFVRKDGSRFEGEIVTTRYESEDGENFGHVTLRDVTERQNTLDALSRSEERLRLALEGGQMGTWDWDARGDRVRWDETQCRLLGVPPGTPGSNATFIGLVHPDDRSAVKAALQKSSTERTDFNAEFRVVRPDGEVRWLAGRGRGAYDESGQLVRMYGVNFDISEQKRAQEAIVDAETASRANLAKTEFLSRMSHELRTPLNAVLGFAQILRLDPTQPLSPKQLERVKLIEQAGEHQLAMINDVLDLSVIESGRISLVLRTVDLCGVVKEATGLVHDAAQKAGITLSIDTRHDVPLFASADPVRLRQVVTNLLTNAIKYNHRGGRVDVTCDVRDSEYSITVTDTGRGLTAAQIEHLFEPFNRLGAERSSIEGTGIGLVIARRLIEQMHGRIEVESVAGRGARFTIFLPSVPAPEADTIAPHDGRTAAGVTRGRSVLYVEDDPVNAQVVKWAFELRPDTTLRWATDGTTALAAVRATLPDLMIIDMRLPDMSGLELIARLQADAATASIPCIALSAEAMPEMIRAARAGGFRDYLTKPFDVNMLLRTVDEALTAG